MLTTPRVSSARIASIRFSTRLFGVLLVVFGALSGASSARAFSHPRIEARGATVVINRRSVVRFAVGNGDSSASERARTVVERLQALRKNGLSPADIQPQRKGRQWRVVVEGESILLYVTRRDARATDSSPAGLAARWAAEIRSALALPPITLSEKEVVIPVGGSRTLTVGGYAEGSVSAHLKADGADSFAKVQAHGRQVTIRGEAVGHGKVRVGVGEDEVTCEVAVKKYAGKMPTGLTAEVTGTPTAPAELVANVAEETLRNGMPTEPGASWRLVSSIHVGRGVAPGETETVTAKISMEGADYLPVVGTATVRVVNRELSARQPAKLYYSNDPEHIRTFRSLFSSNLTGDAPIRVMFHHDNETGQPVAFTVTLSNPTDSDLKAHIVPGFVAPGDRPHQVGYRAGRVFWHNRTHNIGEIVSLPARSTIPIALMELGSNQTASGFAQIALINPPAKATCAVKIAAEPTDATGFPHEALGRLDAWRYSPARLMTDTERTALNNRASLTIYHAVKTVDTTYTVGEHWAFVSVGRPDPKNLRHTADDMTGNLGDYGVIYQIHVTVKNPTDAEQKVTVEFEAGGGPAMGVFNVEGRYCEVNEMFPGDERSLAQLTLHPHETRIVSIETVPLGGSTYPANVIVK